MPKYLLKAFVIVSLAMTLAVPSAGAREDGAYPAAVSLLETGTTVLGEPIRYPEGKPLIVSSIITIAPGQSTGWHRHGSPMYAYLLSGQLEVEYADGRRMTLRQGNALMEAMKVAHIGANLENTPACVLTVFLASETSERTVSLPPPDEPPQHLSRGKPAELVELIEADPRLRIDLRYATADNFMKRVMYPSARALLQKPAAYALKRANDRLHREGYGLIVLDAYRPWQVTRAMWDRSPRDRAFLADPLQGSRHNRGAAVDVTLFEMASGKEVEMPSAFDEFTERAHPNYSGGSEEPRANRDRLRRAMEAEGFRVYDNEWWHFDYHDWASYPVLNLPLDCVKCTSR